MTLKPQHSTRFGFELKNSKAESLKFTFDLQTNKLSVDREKSGMIGFKDNFKPGAMAPLVKRVAYKVRLMVDKASAELFINDGETVMSTLFFPTEIMNSLNIFSSEGNLSAENITIYNIK